MSADIVVPKKPKYWVREKGPSYNDYGDPNGLPIYFIRTNKDSTSGSKIGYIVNITSQNQPNDPIYTHGKLGTRVVDRKLTKLEIVTLKLQGIIMI